MWRSHLRMRPCLRGALAGQAGPIVRARPSIYTISFAFASPNTRCDEIAWIHSGHSTPIGDDVCKTPGQKLALDSPEEEEARRPYCFVDACIFLAQTHEIAWIAGVCARSSVDYQGSCAKYHGFPTIMDEAAWISRHHGRDSIDLKKAERPKASFEHGAHIPYTAIHGRNNGKGTRRCLFH